MEQLGDFKVISKQGRDYLDYSGNQVAVCYTGDYKSRFGDIRGWLTSVQTREKKRLVKIEETLEELEDEKYEREELLHRIRDTLKE